MQALVSALKAAAEPTRLRIVALLAAGELNVKDLTRILGQSQPRISRHLKLLAEAGLIERAREGSWAYFHVSTETDGGRLARRLVAGADAADAVLARDRQRGEAVRQEREQTAQSYFAQHAGDWDRIRALHVNERDVEAAMLEALGPAPCNLLVDIGTGTGRILELFASRYQRGLGFDRNTAMLAYARSKLDRAQIAHAQVRQGDIYDLPLADRSADAVVMHQVLHHLSDPAGALREAARVLAPGGRMVIVDFAPHEHEFLRETQAHERLGFADATIAQWVSEQGLALKSSQHLGPKSDSADGKLTVSIWLACRADAAIDVPSKTSSNLEKVA